MKKSKRQTVTFTWNDPKDTPAFDVYILAEYEFTSMGGPHLAVGELEEVNRSALFFIPKDLDERIEWRDVNRWVYLDDIKGET